MKDIPYKPLSERMLEEPFWLGLITVTAVLILIGICWLLKKHLPERLEKYLVDELEKGRLVERSSSGGELDRESNSALMFVRGKTLPGKVSSLYEVVLIRLNAKSFVQGGKTLII